VRHGNPFGLRFLVRRAAGGGTTARPPPETLGLARFHVCRGPPGQRDSRRGVRGGASGSGLLESLVAARAAPVVRAGRLRRRAGRGRAAGQYAWLRDFGACREPARSLIRGGQELPGATARDLRGWRASLRRPMSRVGRIVSLLPSATEIVCALGLEDRLVGISHSCDYPPSITQLPRLTSPRRNLDGLASAEIDAAVRAALREDGSVYAIDIDAITALEPDLILTQGICDVCAVPESQVVHLSGGT